MFGMSFAPVVVPDLSGNGLEVLDSCHLVVPDCWSSILVKRLLGEAPLIISAPWGRSSVAVLTLRLGKGGGGTGINCRGLS